MPREAAKLGGFDGVAHEHGDGEFADATGDGGAGSGDAGDAGVAVADDGASLFFELLFALFIALEETFEEDRVGDVVDADVEDGCAGLNEFCGDEAGAANGGDEDVSATADGGEIFCARVADGDGGVGIGEEHGEGLADDVTASDDYRFLALGGDIGAAEDLHASERGARDKAGALGAEIADVDGVKSIDVLLRRDGEEDALGIDLGGKGKLDEDSVDVIASVELFDESEEIFRGGAFRWCDQFAEDSDLFAGSHLAADIGLRGGIGSN